MKHCAKCLEHKDSTEFYRRACSGDGLQARCKACVEEDRRAYFATNHDARAKRREHTNEYRARNPHMVSASNRLQVYGITRKQFDDMLLMQGGVCAVCKLPMGQPQVDHDHNTGRVRGILCGGCNTGLGRFGDNIQNLRAAIAYLST